MRQKAIFKSILSVITFALFTLNSFADTHIYAGELTGTDLHWTIAGNDYYIHGDVYVDDNHTLEVDAGVNAYFYAGVYLEIRDGCFIEVNGTSANEVLFTSNESPPNMGDWGCIFFRDASTGHFDYCRIRFAGYDLNIPQYDGVGAILAYGGASLYFEDSEIDSCAGWAVWGYTWDIYTLEIENCDIHHNDNGLFLYVLGHDSFVRHCHIHDNGKGISVHASPASVTNNIFENNEYGIWDMAWGEDARVDNNLVVLNDTGIYLDQNGSGSYMSNNIVVNNTIGIRSYYDYIDYHCIDSNGRDIVGPYTNGGHNIFEDPQFYDDPDDYHLLYISPCINEGDPITPDDPDDSPNDMGIYGGSDAWDPFYAVIPALSMTENTTIYWDPYKVTGNITTNVYT